MKELSGREALEAAIQVVEHKNNHVQFQTDGMNEYLEDMKRQVVGNTNYHFQQYMIMALLLFFFGLWLYGTYRSNQADRIQSIEAQNIKALGSTELCPGDTLLTSYDLTIQGVGAVIWDDTVYHDGNHLVSFNDSRRFIVPESLTLQVIDSWTVPYVPQLLIGESGTWMPGEYRRVVAISALSTFTNRYTEPTTFQTAFTIRDDCDN